MSFINLGVNSIFDDYLLVSDAPDMEDKKVHPDLLTRDYYNGDNYKEVFNLEFDDDLRKASNKWIDSLVQKSLLIRNQINRKYRMLDFSCDLYHAIEDRQESDSVREFVSQWGCEAELGKEPKMVYH